MLSSEPIDLSVILPAYNEGSAVEFAARRIIDGLASLDAASELIIIDDASTDDTSASANNAAQSDHRVRVIRNEKNQGQAISILRGFGAARGRFLIHAAVDLSLDPAHIPTIIDRLRDGADVVVVERQDRSAYGPIRKLISWANVLFVRAAFRSPATDHNFTQAFRKEVFESINVETTGVSTVTTEMIIKAVELGYRVETVRLPYEERRFGESTVTARKIIHTVAELFHLWRVMHSRRWHEQKHLHLKTRVGKGDWLHA